MGREVANSSNLSERPPASGSVLLPKPAAGLIFDHGDVVGLAVGDWRAGERTRGDIEVDLLSPAGGGERVR
jgi:hypothetical protein